MYGLAGEGEKDCGLGQSEMTSWQWWDLSSFSGYVVFGWRSGGLGFKAGGGEMGKKDVVGVPEVGMSEAYKKVMRRPAWQGRRSPWGSGGAGNWRRKLGSVCGTIYTSQQNCWLGLAIFPYSEKLTNSSRYLEKKEIVQREGLYTPIFFWSVSHLRKAHGPPRKWVLWV